MIDIKDRVRNFSPLGVTGHYGIISRDITLVIEPAYYVLPDFDDVKQQEWGPARWSPRVVTTSINVAETPEAPHLVDVATLQFPMRGDECFVGTDNRRQGWILAWWPKS